MRVSLSVIARPARFTAAKAIIPTVAAFNPDKREYTGSGRVLPTREMPTDKLYIPIAPGKLGRLLSALDSVNAKSFQISPEKRKGQRPRHKPTVYRIDTEQHFGTRRPRQSLADREDFLILDQSD